MAVEMTQTMGLRCRMAAELRLFRAWARRSPKVGAAASAAAACSHEPLGPAGLIAAGPFWVPEESNLSTSPAAHTACT